MGEESSRHLSFDCIIEGKRCTKCCEVIHMEKNAGLKIVNRDASTFTDGDWVILKHWKQISRRMAKKINTYMFGPAWSKRQKQFISEAIFFKCTALVDGLCTVYEERPFACREFNGHGMYAYECANEWWENNKKIEVEIEINAKKEAA